MTRATARISQGRGGGSSMPPWCARRLTVRHLVGSHLLQNLAAAYVPDRQSLQMARQMTLDLPLGLADEPQTELIAQGPARAPIASDPAYHSGFR